MPVSSMQVSGQVVISPKYSASSWPGRGPSLSPTLLGSRNVAGKGRLRPLAHPVQFYLFLAEEECPPVPLVTGPSVCFPLHPDKGHCLPFLSFLALWFLPSAMISQRLCHSCATAVPRAFTGAVAPEAHAQLSSDACSHGVVQYWQPGMVGTT